MSTEHPGASSPSAAATARGALRQETRDLHDRVDAAFSGFRLDDAADYGAFLLAQAAAYLPCEAALDRAGAGDVVPGWSARRRAHMLQDDLSRIGLRTPAFDSDAPDAAPVFAHVPSILGGVYVLEGSRLGGAMLIRSVPPHLPRSFLGATMPGAWRDLTRVIDARLRSDAEIAAAVAAARHVFEMFERAGRATTKAG